MSAQTARDFLMKTADDQELRDRIAAQYGDQNDRLAALVEAGRESGYDFTSDDVRTTLISAQASAGAAPLSPGQLDQVVGGVAWYWRWMSLFPMRADSSPTATVGVRG
jgi:predicted ribosomally synthesized peptide with nif11-like leader